MKNETCKAKLTFDEFHFLCWSLFSPLFLVVKGKEKPFCQESLTKSSQEIFTRKIAFINR